MRYPQFLELWRKPKVSDSSSAGPRKLARINSTHETSSANSWISEAAISPDGRHIAFVDSSGLNLLRINQQVGVWDSASPPPDGFLSKLEFGSDFVEEEEIDEVEGDDEVTSLVMTNNAVYYSVWQFSLKRLDLNKLTTRVLRTRKYSFCL